jgi:hypothetical protein
VPILGNITIGTKATHVLRTNALVHTFRLTQRSAMSSKK